MLNAIYYRSGFAMLFKSPRFYLVLALLAALACYSVGFGAGGTAFVVLGVLCELVFWLGLYRVSRK